MDSTKTEGEKAFSFYRYFFWILGVWPLEEESTFQTIRYFIATVAQASLLLHTLVEIYLNNNRVSDMADVYLFSVSAILTLTKQIFLHRHKKRLARTLKWYLNDWMVTNEPDMLNIMRSHVKTYKYLLIGYGCSGYVGTTLFLVRTIIANALRESPDLDYSLVCETSFLSKELVAKYLIPILALQYAQCMYACTSGTGTDCFFFGLTLHLCGQLEILKAKCSEPLRGRSLAGLVRRHQQLLRIGRDLETSFNRTVLVQLLISIVLVCTSGLGILVALAERDYVRVFASTNTICFMITESLIYGYASEYLASQSEDVAWAIYGPALLDCAKTGRRKDVLFFVMRAQIPLCITAGKFFAVTRNTIVQLLKTSVSFLSVVRIALDGPDKP